MGSQKAVVAVGNPFEGLTLYGPFAGPSVAAEWTEPGSNQVTDLRDQAWNVVPLQDPYPEVAQRGLKGEDDFNNFLDDATHAVRELWEHRGGTEMGERELYTLNDLLTQFFADKRSTQP